MVLCLVFCSKLIAHANGTVEIEIEILLDMLDSGLNKTCARSLATHENPRAFMMNV